MPLWLASGTDDSQTRAALLAASPARRVEPSRRGRHFRRSIPPEPHPGRLLERVADGLSGREMADELHIAHDTARTQVHNATAKLGRARAPSSSPRRTATESSSIPQPWYGKHRGQPPEWRDMSSEPSPTEARQPRRRRVRLDVYSTEPGAGTAVEKGEDVRLLIDPSVKHELQRGMRQTRISMLEKG